MTVLSVKGISTGWQEHSAHYHYMGISVGHARLAEWICALLSLSLGKVTEVRVPLDGSQVCFRHTRKQKRKNDFYTQEADTVTIHLSGETVNLLLAWLCDWYNGQAQEFALDVSFSDQSAKQSLGMTIHTH